MSAARWFVPVAALTAWVSASALAQDARASCADCHEQAATFADSPHARGARRAGDTAPLPNAVCSSCHGDGDKHIEAGGDKAFLRDPRGREGAEVCETCHKRSTEHASFQNGAHASTARMSCLSCHSIHKADPTEASLLVAGPRELCASCHLAVVTSSESSPFAHRLRPGALSCVSCHQVHGQPGRHLVRQTKGGELVCVTCHAETRGPFVFPHVTGVAGDCTSCHGPHGSPYPHQVIRAAIAQLCLECHSTLSLGTLGSQPPSVHNLQTARWQSCTVCHTAVHGSSRSPQLFK